MMVRIITPLPNMEVVLQVDNMTGQLVRYYTAAQGGNLLEQTGNTVIRTGANRQVTVYIPVDLITVTSTSYHRWWVGCINSNFLPGTSGDQYRIVVP